MVFLFSFIEVSCQFQQTHQSNVGLPLITAVLQSEFNMAVEATVLSIWNDTRTYIKCGLVGNLYK